MNSKSKILDMTGATAIESNDTIRTQKCMQEIQRVVAFYRCDVLPFVTIGPFGVMNAGFNVVAKPMEDKQ